jgi:phosphoglycerol transferase MdoB-like AlkP superfamily enzyme
MKPIARYLLLFFVFWLLVFTISRTAFVISIVARLDNASFGEIVHSLFAGFFLDLSTIAYFIALSILLSVLYFIIRTRWIAIINDLYVIIVIVLYCLTAFGELALYQEWKTKLNLQALLHFAHPAEVFQTATFKLTVLFFGLSILFSFLFIRLYRKKFTLSRIKIIPLPLWQRIIFGIIFLASFLALDVIILRGGLKAIPISESDAYYSKYRMLNDAAVNPVWSLGHNIMDYSSHQKANPYHVMPDKEAQRIMNEMFSAPYDSTEEILTIPKPNIVFIMLESFTSYSIPVFGGDPYCMFLDSLARQGIAFTKCYAAGYVSDQGIPALLSAYPSAPHLAAINLTSKSVNLPCLNKDLKQIGYNSGFYFGGQLNYGNIKSYLYNMQFDNIKERNDYNEKVDEGKLGIHDGSMQKIFLKEVDKSKAPFLACWFTLSSHSPYDIPVQIKPIVNHRQNPFVNTMIYTDNALRDFFAEAKKKEWFRQTLFVIVADHSHENHHDFDFDQAEFHHIPFLLFGDVIKPEFRGKKVEKICSQLDIVPTLLHQLHLKNDSYIYGKNILNSATKSFAYFYYFTGIGLINENCFAAFSAEQKVLVKTNCRDSIEIMNIKKMSDAFLQIEFEDYLSR